MNATYRRACVAVFDRDETCVNCGDPGNQIHHRLPRGMGGARHDPTAHALSRLVLLCSPCHTRVESDRLWAVAQGLIVPRGQHPALTPIRYRNQWLRLSDDGGTEVM